MEEEASTYVPYRYHRIETGYKHISAFIIDSNLWYLFWNRFLNYLQKIDQDILLKRLISVSKKRNIYLDIYSYYAYWYCEINTLCIVIRVICIDLRKQDRVYHDNLISLKRSLHCALCSLISNFWTIQQSINRLITHEVSYE